MLMPAELRKSPANEMKSNSLVASILPALSRRRLSRVPAAAWLADLVDVLGPGGEAGDAWKSPASAEPPPVNENWASTNALGALPAEGFLEVPCGIEVDELTEGAGRLDPAIEDAGVINDV